MRLLTIIFQRAVNIGRLEVTDPDGTCQVFGGHNPGPDVSIRVSDRAADRKAALRQELWFAEAYMDGTLTFERGNIYELLSLLLNKGQESTSDQAVPFWRQMIRQYVKLMHLLPVPSVSRKDIQNYQKGYSFFSKFLDEGMHFSCAYWKDGVSSLEEAQISKLRHIAAKLDMKPEQRVLDIGCGWGGMALYLAKMTDARVTAVTLSEDQYNVARKRAEILGLSNRVEFRLQDYNLVTEKFDRIVSIAMLEHVGRKNLQNYFSKVRQRLNDDGVALIHSITSKAPPARSGAFIRKYFDPDGCAPSLSETFKSIENTGLWPLDCEILRLHYSKTLFAWRNRFSDARPGISETHGEEFTRMWEFYLGLCQCAFEYGQSCVFQIQLGTRRDGVPLTREYIEVVSAELQKKEEDHLKDINRSLVEAINALGIETN